MFTSVRSFLRKLLTQCGYAFGTALMSFWRRPVAESDSSVSVHMLVSSTTWHAGVLAAISFEFFTQRRWNLFVHEDGSVDEMTRKKIEKVLPGVHVISRTDSEEVMKERLSGYPDAQELRQKHNLFLKFFDLPAFAPGKRMILLDSDIIFFKKPQEILDWVDSQSEECWYNEDTKEKYCIPRYEIEPALQVKLWPRFNSGLVLIPLEAISLPLSERLLTTFKTTAHHPQFFEQTLYALMSSVWGKGGALPQSYEISWGLLRNRGSICRHYVGAFKHDLLYIEGVMTLFWKIVIASNITDFFLHL